jgi:hypothetical protein
VPANPTPQTDPLASLAAAIAAAQAGAGAGTVSQSRSDMLASQTKVYMGRGYNGSQLGDVYGTVSDGYEDFYSMSDSDRNSLGKLMHSYGLVNDPNNYDQILARWQQAVDEAGKYYNLGQRKVDPYDALGIMAGLSPGETPGARQSKTTTQTAKSVNTFTPGQIKSLVSTIFQQQMGRDPTAGEIARYSGQIAGAARANPSITKTTTTVDPNGNVSSSSASSGGYTADDATSLVDDRTKVDPEYGAYQAATTYMNALTQALGGV